MRALTFAARNLLRQPARAWLGVLGVAAVGALLFDMLLLSNGLVISMEQLLNTTGFDIRAGIGVMVPGGEQLIEDAATLADRFRALPEVADAMPIRFADGLLARTPRPLGVRVMGGGGRGRPAWTLLRGRDLTGAPGEALVNQRVLDVMRTRIGGTLNIRTSAQGTRTVAPAERLTIVGVAEFPFESERGTTIGLSLAGVDRVAGGTGAERAEQFLITTATGVDPKAAKAAIERTAPGMTALTNDQLLVRLQQGGLSYFRQISFVLTTVTVGFAFLLVTVLLTVSVNQRLGEIAGLRALGFSKRRAMADVISEAVLIVGTGAIVALPLGLGLARILDWILKSIPGIPASLHFFVFQPQALVVHLVLFALTAVAAAAYPVRLVATLPIAATLRREVVS